MNRSTIGLGAIFGFLGVLFGAFGAHALRDRFAPGMAQVYETGVHYQLAHALALILVGLIPAESRLLTWTRHLFVWGIVLFSFSLYILAITATRRYGAITPFGGVCFLAGWACLAIWAFRKPLNDS